MFVVSNSGTSLYADPKYDAKHMEEIRLKLQAAKEKGSVVDALEQIYNPN